MNELVSTHGYSQNQIMVWKYPSLSKVTCLCYYISSRLYAYGGVHSDIFFGLGRINQYKPKFEIKSKWGRVNNIELKSGQIYPVHLY